MSIEQEIADTIKSAQILALIELLKAKHKVLFAAVGAFERENFKDEWTEQPTYIRDLLSQIADLTAAITQMDPHWRQKISTS